MDRMCNADKADVLAMHEALVQMAIAHAAFQKHGNIEAYHDEIATESNTMSHAVCRIISRNGWAL